LRGHRGDREDHGETKTETARPPAFDRLFRGGVYSIDAITANQIASTHFPPLRSHLSLGDGRERHPPGASNYRQWRHVEHGSAGASPSHDRATSFKVMAGKPKSGLAFSGRHFPFGFVRRPFPLAHSGGGWNLHGPSHV